MDLVGAKHLMVFLKGCISINQNTGVLPICELPYINHSRSLHYTKQLIQKNMWAVILFNKSNKNLGTESFLSLNITTSNIQHLLPWISITEFKNQFI